MPEFSLLPHPDFPSTQVTAIRVIADRPEHDLLQLQYDVEGHIHPELRPVDARGGFADELWKHTCFEAFVGAPDRPHYVEINVAPSTLWAAYTFDSYREGMRPLAELYLAPAVSVQLTSARLQLQVALPMLADLAFWQVGLSTIIEADDGGKSYWALKHAPGPPDFHNPDCFLATLPAPTRP